MKILHLVFATLAIGVASISSAQAHDSFSFGLNIGTPYYYQPYQPPVVTYYPNPPVYYYGAPRTYYYQAAPPVYYAPQASFGYWNGGHRGWGNRWHDDDHGERHWRHHDHDDD